MLKYINPNRYYIMRNNVIHDEETINSKKKYIPNGMTFIMRFVMNNNKIKLDNLYKY